MTYIDGLKLAELLCAERSKKALREARTSEFASDRLVFTCAGMEALECAIAIRNLVDLAPLEDANGG